jgi:Resolvase, N terminal domain
MHGQRIGYIRVSTLDQHTEWQLEGIEVDKTFLDKASGKDTKRPQLDQLMSFVRTGFSYLRSNHRRKSCTQSITSRSCGKRLRHS